MLNALILELKLLDDNAADNAMTLDGYPSTGVPTCADSKLLTGLARETFGFGEPPHSHSLDFRLFSLP